MNSIIATLTVFSFQPAVELPTAVWQLAPATDGEMKNPQKTKTKALLCIPGLYPHPIRPEKATMPEMHPWFEPKAPLLSALANDFDIYGFGYAQTLPIDLVANAHGLFNAVTTLKRAGYKEIVLIGHSAGGLVAWQFAQRFPNAGVTKIIPVAAPFTGSELADYNLPLPSTQVMYIKSLAPIPRRESLAVMPEFPKHIEVCCVLCKIQRISNDFMVSLESQWPQEVRRQGIPCTLVNVNHFEAIKAPQAVTMAAKLANAKLIRWPEADTAKAAEIIYGKDADAAAATAPKRDRPVLNKLRELLDR